MRVRGRARVRARVRPRAGAMIEAKGEGGGAVVDGTYPHAADLHDRVATPL